jgi:thiosulfate dehydrogenase [quinone] large subunit
MDLRKIDLAAVRRPEVTGLLWLVARVWVGWEFLQAGWDKVQAPERAVWIGAHAGLAEQGFLNFSLQLAPGGALVQQGHPEVMGWYATLIRHVFLPHTEVFSYLVTFGEVLVGLALVFGIVTRFSAFMGLLMNLSYLLAGVSSFSPLMVLIQLPIVLGGTTATYYAIDRFLLPYLRARLPRAPRPTWVSPRVAPSA